MKRMLLSFGDSWTYGAELPEYSREKDNYTGQLCQMLEIDSAKNFSEVGSAISHLQVQFRKAIDQWKQQICEHQTLAIFFLTGQERFLFFDYRGEFASLTPSGYIARPLQHDLRSQFENIYNFYYKNIQSKQADKISLNTNLLALQSMCKYYGITDYYISGWESLDLWPEVNRSRIYARGHQSCRDILNLDSDLKNDQFIVKNGSHPNADGHRLIAEALSKMINQSI